MLRKSGCFAVKSAWIWNFSKSIGLIGPIPYLRFTNKLGPTDDKRLC